MDHTEKAAIAATLPLELLLSRVADVARSQFSIRGIGDPLNNNEDSSKLRELFGLTIEHTISSTFCFNGDDNAEESVCAAVRGACGGGRQDRARRATLYAVASLWVKEMSIVMRKL